MNTSYILGLTSFYIFFERRTLKFLKMKGNPTNKNCRLSPSPSYLLYSFGSKPLCSESNQGACQGQHSLNFDVFKMKYQQE